MNIGTPFPVAQEGPGAVGWAHFGLSAFELSHFECHMFNETGSTANIPEGHLCVFVPTFDEVSSHGTTNVASGTTSRVATHNCVTTPNEVT